jgi:signal transduction histidine kinase/ligand-binding sensor domain-containing protein/DNA-binding response OmpR family regulator
MGVPVRFSYADKNEYAVVNRISSYDGLADNKLLSIQQDACGRLWIGTTMGLSCYDGHRYTNYRKGGRQGHSLSNNNAQSILTLDNGDVWIATSNLLNVYDYSLDLITTIGPEQGLNYTDITSLAPGANGVIWVGTYGNGLVMYDRNTGIFSEVTLNANGRVPSHIMALYEDSNNHLWIGDRFEGLFRYDIAGGRCRKVSTISSSEYIRAIHQDRSGNIWIGSIKSLYYAQGDFVSEVPNQLLRGQSICGITDTSDGRVWVGGEEILAYFYPSDLFVNQQAASVQTFEEGNSIDRISYKSVRCIYADSNDNVWVGTYGGGLNHITGPGGVLGLFKPIGEFNRKSSGNKTMSISKDSHGVLWIGLDGNGLVRYSPDGTRRHYLADGRSRSIHDNNLLSVLASSDGSVWLGGYKDGLARKMPDSESFRDYGNILGNPIRKIFQSKDGTVWFGSSQGLYSYVPSGDSFIHHMDHFEADVRAIAEADDDTLWLGTYGDGMVCYDRKSGDYRQFNKSESLRSNIIYDIVVSGNSLWIATEEGLSVMDKQGKNLLPDNIDRQVVDRRILSVEKSTDGDFWLSTSDCLIKVSLPSFSVRRYVPNKELQIGEYSEGCSALISDDCIMFGGFGGVSIVHIQEKENNVSLPKLIFTRLSIFGNTVEPDPSGNRRAVLNENINIQRSFKLRAAENLFTIEFSVPDYTSDIHYSYRLKNIDREWIQLGTQNFISLRDLSPDDYVLEVCSAKEGQEQTDTINFKVLPPLWLSIWAKLFYFLLCGGLLYFIWVFLSTKIRLSHKIELEQTKRMRDEEINEAKLTFFTNMSHELRTPLTLLIAPLAELERNETNAEKLKNITRITSNANRLLSLVNQILDFRKTEKGMMKLQVGKVNIIEYIEKLFYSFSELAAEKSISIGFETMGENDETWVDTSMIDKICINLLSNSYKYTPSGGRIVMTVETDDSDLTVTLSDNGRGILPQSRDLIFQRFFQEKRGDDNTVGSGVGLHLVKSLVELHHGTISFESTPSVLTTFRFSIPIRREMYSEDEITPRDMHPVHFLSDTEAINIDSVSPEMQLQKPIIIVADDNDEIREYLEETLSKHYIVKPCRNGLEVLELCVQGTLPDLIICDIMMPEMDGQETCRRLKNDFDTSHIPIIMLTAKSTIEDMISGLETGADAYITKPFHLQHLIVQIKKLLEIRGKLRLKYRKQLYFKEGGDDWTHSPEEKFIGKLTTLVLDNISEQNLNGDTLAAMLNSSRSSLHRKLKSVLGISTGDFIRNVRLSKAAKLLIDSEKTISEICFDVGFNSPSYFTTSFTTQYGVTPKQYRNG